jgi:DNA polymerase
MKPTGIDNPLYYIIGEAPGEQEDMRGVQFVGESGQILRSTLMRLLDLEDISELEDCFRWNNCVRCRPRSGKANRTPTEIEIECCRKSLEKDIEETKPKVILGFGNIPLKWLLRTEGIMIYRGRYVPVKIGNHVCWYFPMLHPSFILRNQRKDKNGRVMPGMYDHIFEKDLDNVFAIAEDLPDPKIITKGYTDNVEVVLGDKIEDITRIKEALHGLKQAHKVGVDIETRGLRPYNNGTIYCIAFGTFEYTIAFPLDHPKAWNNLEKSKDDILVRLMELVEDFLLTSGIKIAHNLKFELEWFHFYFGKDILYKTKWIDTQAYSYLINERTSKGTSMHSLDTQTLVNFGFNLKALSTKVDRIKPLTAVLDDLLLYNGMDTKWTVALEDALYKKLLQHKGSCLSSYPKQPLHLCKYRTKDCI